MTVSAYFDGSGKLHDPHSKVMVLAGYVGSSESWREFEVRWEEFKKKNSIDYFHASEVNARRGHFKTATNMGGVLLRGPITELLRDFSKDDFYAVAHAISLEEYRGIPDPKRSPEDICGDGCLTTLCEQVSAFDTLQVFYDRGESFFNRLQNNWRDRKKRAADRRLDRLNVFSEVDDWRKYGAMQAADYLACCISRTKTHPVWPRRFDMLTRYLNLYGGHYTGEDLVHLATHVAPIVSWES
jgi:hypothetical protein